MPNDELIGLLAEGMALKSGWPGRGDKMRMSALQVLAAHDREVAEKAWDEGAKHVYTEGGKCSFARDGDPCPYNPYRTEASRLREGRSRERSRRTL